MKEYQSELTKANRRKAEDRILDSITVRCKECRRLMPRCMRHDENPRLYYCLYCERWGGAVFR